MAGSGALTDWISLGVLASSVPRDVVDEAIAETGRGAQRAGGKLPPHVVVYLVMALALFADDDYEEVAARLTETLRGWGCWGDWEVPTKGGITQARKRLGPEPLAQVFSQVAGPVADLDTTGAFLGPWRLMSVDGMEWDVPDTDRNRAVFGVRGDDQAAFPKIRVVTVSECGSHAPVLAVMGPAAGGKGSGEQSLARKLYPRLEEDWLVIASPKIEPNVGARQLPAAVCAVGGSFVRAGCCGVGKGQAAWYGSRTLLADQGDFSVSGESDALVEPS